MIKETILLTGTTLMLFELPFYKDLVKSKRKRINTVQMPCVTDEDKSAIDTYLESSKINEQMDRLYNPSDYMPGRAIAMQMYYVKETNWMARKPFTCLYCMTFWIGVICAALSFILFVDLDHTANIVAASIVAPALAAAFDRWFNSLPVKL